MGAITGVNRNQYNSGVPNERLYRGGSLSSIRSEADCVVFRQDDTGDGSGNRVTAIRHR